MGRCQDFKLSYFYWLYITIRDGNNRKQIGRWLAASSVLLMFVFCSCEILFLLFYFWLAITNHQPSFHPCIMYKQLFFVLIYLVTTTENVKSCSLYIVDYGKSYLIIFKTKFFIFPASNYNMKKVFRNNLPGWIKKNTGWHWSNRY